MNISSSKETEGTSKIPFATFDYRDTRPPVPPPPAPDPAEQEVEEQKAPPGPTPEEINAMLSSARAEAITQTENRMRNEFEVRLAAEAALIRKALDNFEEERKEYYSRVEGEIVKLSLAIAAKILHRESQVDPLLLTALVRVAMERLHDGSSVSVRVAPANADRWRKYLSENAGRSMISVVEDAQLGTEDCIIETDLGSTNFSIDAQLKEIEQGFFDLLAQRPK